MHYDQSVEESVGLAQGQRASVAQRASLAQVQGTARSSLRQSLRASLRKSQARRSVSLSNGPAGAA